MVHPSDCANVDIKNLLGSGIFCPLNVIHVVGVPAVDEDVSWCEVRQQIGDGLINNRSRNHQPPQENRSEISIQGTGFFTKDTAGNGVFERANETGGFLVGYRYNFNRWFAAEANYGYDRNTQFYFGGPPARVQSDIHQITGSAVVKLPTFARLQPYALAGAGALVFGPTGNSGGSFVGATL
jgi:hypothetical protein